jgi:hypothetical protein
MEFRSEGMEKVRTVQGTWVPIGVLWLAYDPDVCFCVDPACPIRVSPSSLLWGKRLKDGDRMLAYESEALLAMTRPKGRRGSCLGASLLRMSLRRNPKRILFTPAVAIDGKGRKDRENEFRMVIGYRAGRLSGG